MLTFNLLDARIHCAVCYALIDHNELFSTYCEDCYAEECEKFPGFVYFIEAPLIGRVKIGYSTDPSRRLKELSTGAAEHLEIITTFPANPSDEKAIHSIFWASRSVGEWFKDTPMMQAFTGALYGTRLDLHELVKVYGANENFLREIETGGTYETPPAEPLVYPNLAAFFPPVVQRSEPTVPPESLLSVREVAARLRVSTSTVYSMVEGKQLRCVRVSNAIRVAPADLSAFITAQAT